jgi:peptidoglycan/LPS O-acetylase OafA/YrhL
VLPVLVLILAKGSAWTVANFFWVDLAAAPAIALLLAAVATERPKPLVWLLDTRPVRSLGKFSYSLYLVHAPIVLVVAVKVAQPWLGTGLDAFWLTLAIAVPVSLVFARLFAAVFEIPFQRYRSFTALRAAISDRGGSAPETPPGRSSSEPETAVGRVRVTRPETPAAPRADMTRPETVSER